MLLFAVVSGATKFLWYLSFIVGGFGFLTLLYSIVSAITKHDYKIFKFAVAIIIMAIVMFVIAFGMGFSNLSY